MRQFTGEQYLQIELANQFGLDKKTWDERIEWHQLNRNNLDALIDDAKHPILFYKALLAYRDMQDGIPTGFIMGMDATASGIQIMAVLTGCIKTAMAVNLIDTGAREDVYQFGADTMTKFGVPMDKETIKKPIMTHFYGSRAKPIEIFGKGTPALKAFYKFLADELPGASNAMRMMQRQWKPDALEHRFTMPDGHVVVAKVIVDVDKRLEIDELNHATFTHRSYVNAPDPEGLSLAANITHAVDGYVVREMIRRCDAAGFQMATIHDSFWASPNNMNQVRQFYLDILIEISRTNLLANILSEIRGNPGNITKIDSNFTKMIQTAEYHLS